MSTMTNCVGSAGRAIAFVMSSFARGVLVALMEAMATGLPCVPPRISLELEPSKCSNV